MRLTVLDIARNRLCSGCGACGWADRAALEMVDDADHGRRPHPRLGARPPRVDPASICPGLGVHRPDLRGGTPIPELMQDFGPVLEIWEGHATDERLRHAASSGGVISALAITALEHAGMHGVLHTRARPDAPYLNETTLSRTAHEVTAACGSRYAPASPCDGLGLVESAPGACVMIGKPCDVSAAVSAAAASPLLGERLGLTIALFCAGTPTTRGTLEVLGAMGVESPDSLLSLRYRGDGWPGACTAEVQTAAGTQTRRLSYEQSWGAILTKHKQWRCQICADHFGERADISVGDPWHTPPKAGEAGRSLVLVRTERGAELLRLAVRGGLVRLTPSTPAAVLASQPSLIETQASVWGRLLAMRLAGMPAPTYPGIPLFRRWWETLSAGQKLRSVLGTLRRIFRRRLWRSEVIRPMGTKVLETGRGDLRAGAQSRAA